MQTKKLNNFRDEEHGAKAKPLVKNGEEIKARGLLEEQESYYLQSAHLFKLDGADLEKPEPPFRASKHIVEKIRKDRAASEWFSERPGFGGDPDNTPIPEWYQQLMSLLGPWMAGGGQMIFFHSNAGYSAADHTFESGDFHGFHSEMWRIQREAREFVIQQLFDFDQDGVSLGMDQEVQDYIYNYLIDQNPANSWITPDMITPSNLHGLGHYYSQTNPNYNGDLELRWIGPDGQQVLTASGGIMGPTSWLHDWMNSGPGAEYALANEWQWPPSIDPFGLWQSLAEGAPMPPDPLAAMYAGSQFLVQMVNYQDGTSNPEDFPEIDFDIDYEAAGYESLLDYYVNTSELYAQNPIMLYYQYITAHGEGSVQHAGSSFFYPHYLQQLLETLGIDIDPSINTDYSGYATGNIDDFFTGPGMEEYQALLDLMSLHHNETGDTDSGMASMLQAYMSSNGEYGWNAQLGAYMDWYATGVEAGFIELSEAGYDAFEAAYTAYTGDPDNPFNWFWFDFSEEIGSDNFLNIYEYTLSPDGYSPDWGQTFGSDASYNEGGSYGNSYYDFDPQADLNYVTDAAGYQEAFPLPGVFEGGVPEWYTFLSHTMAEWNQNFSVYNTSTTFPEGTLHNHYDFYYDFMSHTLNTIFNYDGDNNVVGNEMQYLADLGYPIGQMMIDWWDSLLPEGVTTGLTISDLTPELLEISWQSGGLGTTMYNLLEAVPAFQENGIYHIGSSQLGGWLTQWGSYNNADEFGTGNSLLNSTWHADFFNGSAYAMANGGNGMPPALDPLGIWAYNTSGEGTAAGWGMGGSETGHIGFAASQGAIAMFMYFGNQGMENDQDGNLYSGTSQFANSEGWAIPFGGGYAFLNAVNYLTGYFSENGVTGAGYYGNEDYPSIWTPLYDYIYETTGIEGLASSDGMNEFYANNPDLVEQYQPEDPQSWELLSSFFSVINQYLNTAPGNPLMPGVNFMQDQIDLMDWYLQGVVGMGSEDDPDTWNGPLLSEMSDVAIQNVVTAIETGSFWFDFTYDITDDNFLWSTNTNTDQFYGDGFSHYSGQGGSWDEEFTYIDIDPGAGMENLLGENPILDLSNWVSSHGGLIDYNGDGRVDMGDFLEFVSWSNYGSSSGAEMYGLIDMTEFIEFGLFNSSAALGIGEGNGLNNLSDASAISGGTNWLFSPLNVELLPGFLEGNFQNTPAGIDSYGGATANISSGGADAGVFSYGSLMATFMIFQFVNDYVDSGGSVPDWYNFILGQEADDAGFGGQVEFGDSEGFDFSSGGINTLLNAVYPQWSEWSESTGFDFGEQDVNTTVVAIVGMIEALLPPVEVMTNYASYYLAQGIDINQQFVNADGSTVNVVSGGNSLSEGLDAELFSVSQQNYVVGLVSNNAPAFAALDVNQDGEYGTVDYLATSLVTALLTEWFTMAGLGAGSELNLNDVIVQLYNNHTNWSVINTPWLLNDINLVNYIDDDAGGSFGGSTNIREALNYLLNVVQFDGFISTDPEAPSQPSAYDIQAALIDLFTSVATSMLELSGQGVEVVNPGVLTGDWTSLSDDDLINLLGETYTVLIFNNAAETPSGLPEGGLAVLQTLFEGTDGTYFLDADGNQVPFSFTAAGLQALAGSTYGSQAGSGASIYQTEEWNEAYQDIAQALGEAGFGVDFNGDGVYDINDINVLLNIVENGPQNSTQVQIAEILNYVDGNNSVDFGIDDVIMFMNFFGNPGETMVYGEAGSAYSWIDGDGDQTVYGAGDSFPASGVSPGGIAGASINMFGYFDDSGAWVDYDYDNFTPDDYFGPGWAATQTNNNETTS